MDPKGPSTGPSTSSNHGQQQKIRCCVFYKICFTYILFFIYWDDDSSTPNPQLSSAYVCVQTHNNMHSLLSSSTTKELWCLLFCGCAWCVRLSPTTIYTIVDLPWQWPYISIHQPHSHTLPFDFHVPSSIFVIPFLVVQNALVFVLNIPKTRGRSVCVWERERALRDGYGTLHSNG